MNRIHAVAIAAVLAIAAVVGVSAATKTSTLGASASQASEAAIATRSHRLDSFEAGLRKALRSKPPAMPKLPAVHAATAGSLPVSASTTRVIYRRPAPLIIHKHPRHGEDGYESEDHGRGSGDD
jgi:hypothetical protein